MPKMLWRLLAAGVMVVGAFVAQPAANTYESCNDRADWCYSFYYTSMGTHDCVAYEGTWLCEYECVDHQHNQVIDQGQCYW